MSFPSARNISPLVGVLGFRGLHATHPPEGWRLDHQWAEAGGYQRTGRRWTPVSEPGMTVPIPCAPVCALYDSPAIVPEMGWCVDA